MKRRTIITIAAGLGISGCLDFQETQEDAADDGSRESTEFDEQGDDERSDDEASDDSSERRIAGVELTELRDLGGPRDEPNPTFAFGDHFGATASRRDQGTRMVLMDAEGEVVWESERIDADYSIRTNFTGTSERYYVWFVRDERTYVRVFDPNTGAERWTREIVDRNERQLDEIVATETGVFQLTTAEHSDQYDQNPKVTHLDNDGTERWAKTLQQEGYGRALLAYEDDLYVGISGKVLRLDAQSGDVVTTYGSIRPSHNGFTRQSNDMYVDTVEGFLRFDLASHEIVWNNEDARRLRGRPVVADDVVVVPSEAGWIDAYGTADGGHRWETRLDQEVRSLTRTGRVIWPSGHDDMLYGFDIGSGDRVYERDDGQYGGVVALNDRVSITDYDEATLYRVEVIEEG